MKFIAESTLIYIIIVKYAIFFPKYAIKLNFIASFKDDIIKVNFRTIFL